MEKENSHGLFLSGWYSKIYVQKHNKVSNTFLQKPTESLHAQKLTFWNEHLIFSLLLCGPWGACNEGTRRGERWLYSLLLQDLHKQPQSNSKRLCAKLLISLVPLCSKGSFCKLSFCSQEGQKSHFMCVSLIIANACNKLLFLNSYCGDK